MQNSKIDYKYINEIFFSEFEQEKITYAHNDAHNHPDNIWYQGALYHTQRHLRIRDLLLVGILHQWGKQDSYQDLRVKDREHHESLFNLWYMV